MLKFCKQIKEWTPRKLCRHGDRMAYMRWNNVVLHFVLMMYQPWSWKIVNFPELQMLNLELWKINAFFMTKAMQWTEFCITYQERKQLFQVAAPMTNTYVQNSQNRSQYKHTIELLTVTYSGQTLVLENREPWTRSVQQWREEKGAGRNKEISADPEGWSEDNQRSEESEIRRICWGLIFLLLVFYSATNKKQAARKWNLARSRRLVRKELERRRNIEKR